MKQVIDTFYLKKVKRMYSDEPYLQCIYTNGIDTKFIAVKFGETISTTIYEARR